MTATPAPIVRQRPPRAPLQGAAWLAARLSLALRRTRRFVSWWLGVGGTLTVIALLLPVAGELPSASSGGSGSEGALPDTAVAASTLERVRLTVSEVDTVLQLARQAHVDASLNAAARPPATQDPRLPGLEERLRAARATRSLTDLLALASDPTVRYGPRMQATADSLQRATTESERVRLTNIIIAMAQYRRNAIREETGAAQAETPRRALPDTMAALAERAAWQDSLQRAERAYADAVAARRRAQADRAAGRAPVPPLSPGLALLSLVGLGLVLRVGLALTRELREPRLAHPIEAERAVGAPVLAYVRDALPEGPPRFKPSGVDPFRVLYLGLTATGTRARTLIVTGEDAVIVAAVGARLAIAAAADHRTTLVAETEPEHIALARVFRDHAEPGLNDAAAGVFTWREVARSVGSSDGLAITMLPAGTARDPLTPEQEASAATDFADFRERFEFTILAVTLRDLPRARRLVPGAPTVLCASVGDTLIAQYTAASAQVESTGERLHSVVLWDAPRPLLPSRAELAALLSKRKGRTPGGSFKAVQEATKKPV